MLIGVGETTNDGGPGDSGTHISRINTIVTEQQQLPGATASTKSPLSKIKRDTVGDGPQETA